MANFKDKNGREWVLAIDGPTIKMVREELQGLDLADLTGKSYDRLATDIVLFVDCLWLLCREQAQAAGIDDVQFGKSLDGDAVDRATVAMQESMANFFPPSSRALFLATTTKTLRVRQLGMERAVTRINDPSLETASLESLDGIMDRAIASATIRSGVVTNTPAPSTSAPTG